MDTISFVEQEAPPTEHSLRLSAGGQNAEVFPRRPLQSRKLWPPWPPPVQRISALVQSWLFPVPADTGFVN